MPANTKDKDWEMAQSFIPVWSGGHAGKTTRLPPPPPRPRPRTESRKCKARSKPMLLAQPPQTLVGGPLPRGSTQQLGWGPRLAVCHELPGAVGQLVRGAQ